MKGADDWRWASVILPDSAILASVSAACAPVALKSTAAAMDAIRTELFIRAFIRLDWTDGQCKKERRIATIPNNQMTPGSCPKVMGGGSFGIFGRCGATLAYSRRQSLVCLHSRKVAFMHVCVLGAGIVGLATAWQLERRGHQVTVIDRAAPGAGASGGNGAQLSYSYVQPLADPSIWKQLPKLLLSPTSPLKLRPQLDPLQWRWGMAFLAACNAQTSSDTTAKLLALAASSRTAFEAMQADIAPDCDFSATGKLVLYASAAALAGARAQLELQRTMGSQQRIVAPDECIAIEPALASYRSQMAGAVYTPSECAADCLKVCAELMRSLEARGVRFLPGTDVHGFARNGHRIAAVHTSQGDIEADAFVMALGSASPKLRPPPPPRARAGRPAETPAPGPGRAPRHAQGPADHRAAGARTVEHAVQHRPRRAGFHAGLRLCAAGRRGAGVLRADALSLPPRPRQPITTPVRLSSAPPRLSVTSSMSHTGRRSSSGSQSQLCSIANSQRRRRRMSSERPITAPVCGSTCTQVACASANTTRQTGKGLSVSPVMVCGPRV